MLVISILSRKFNPSALNKEAGAYLVLEFIFFSFLPRNTVLYNFRHLHNSDHQTLCKESAAFENAHNLSIVGDAVQQQQPEF